MLHRCFLLPMINDLESTSKCTHQWEMLFNPDPSKQEQEVYFSRNLNQSLSYH